MLQSITPSIYSISAFSKQKFDSKAYAGRIPRFRHTPRRVGSLNADTADFARHELPKIGSHVMVPLL